jgi:hypothetical protein
VQATQRRLEFFQAAAQFLHRLADGTETRQHQADIVFSHPLGVVALLRHRPGIAHHDHWQALLHRFA